MTQVTSWVFLQRHHEVNICGLGWNVHSMDCHQIMSRHFHQLVNIKSTWVIVSMFPLYPRTTSQTCGHSFVQLKILFHCQIIELFLFIYCPVHKMFVFLNVNTSLFVSVQDAALMLSVLRDTMNRRINLSTNNLIIKRRTLNRAELNI